MQGIAVARSVAVAACLIIGACGRISFDALGTPSDGNGSANGDGAMDSVSGFCGTVPAGYVICEDFDSGNLTDRWTLEFQNGGSVSTDTSLSVSPPASLASLFETQPTQGLAFADLLFDAGPAKSIQLRSSLYLPQRPTSPYEINEIHVDVQGVGDFYCDFEIAVTGADRWRQEFFPDVGTYQGRTDLLDLQITTGAWHDVVVDLDFTAMTYLVTIDGAIATQEMFAYPIQPGIVSVQVGPSYVTTGISGAGAYQDNVVLYVTR